jgi:YidC/Oxa1 family membrane protein insertase
MLRMKDFEPHQKAIQAKYEKFGSDMTKKAEMQKELMALYKKNGHNPMGGCLPMLLQMPVWFALYAALQTSVELYREPFLWMTDLTVKDPFFILPVAMGVTSFIMQKLSPQPADNTQAKMMLYFMPGFFTILMLFVPGGLTLYIFVNNLLSIAQQQYMQKRQAAVAAPAK